MTKIIAFLTKVENNRNFWFLLVLSVIFFFLRLPSLFEPYWYSDEGIYQVIGFGLAHGRGLYTGVWDNKPPLLYVIYGLLDGNQFKAKLASLIFGLLTIIAFYFVTKYVLNKRKAVYLATAVFALLFGLPILEGNIANAENFLLLPLLLGALILLKPASYENRKALFAGGILLSLGFLFKVVAVFDAVALTSFLFILHFKNKKQIVKQLKNLLPLAYGFLLPVLLVSLYFLFAGSLVPYLKASFTQNVGYVGVNNNLFIPDGLLLVKAVILVLTVFLLFTKRGKLPTHLLFIFLWLAFELFDSFFSQRGFTHYLLLSLPSFSLLIGAIVQDKARRLTLLILALFVLWLAGTNFIIYQPVISYYTNFISFITNHESTTSYRSFFDPNTPKRYAVADFIINNTKPGDNVFVWTNNPEIYRLAQKLPPGRFSAAYHITASGQTISETAKALKKVNPKYIIITPVPQDFPFPLPDYKQVIMLDDSTIYEHS